MSEIAAGEGRYRKNVGIVVFNHDGKVLLGRRADEAGPQVWQFPQGGVDGKEKLIDAARRELWEETGIRSVRLLAQTDGWISYDFPPGFKGSKAARGFRGQTQAWFAFRFEGDEREIDLAHHQIEFDAWRWADIDEAPDLVVDFKREAYLQVLAAFRPLARPEAVAEGEHGTILMIHGVGCTGRAWDRMAADFRGRGWSVRAPTLAAALRVPARPSPELNALGLADYVREAEGWAGAIEAETGRAPVLIGHSMGGLIVQKLMERGVGRAGVLVTPASPAGVPTKLSASVVFTFANILVSPNYPVKPHKVWRTGFDWGVLNCVPKVCHAAIYAEAVYDSGRVYRDLASPEKDPEHTAFIDAAKIAAPMLVIAGGQDRATPPAGVRAVAAKYAGVGVEFREYSDNAHWIIDEPGTDRVVADIDAWLAAKLP